MDLWEEALFRGFVATTKDRCMGYLERERERDGREKLLPTHIALINWLLFSWYITNRYTERKGYWQFNSITPISPITSLTFNKKEKRDCCVRLLTYWISQLWKKWVLVEFIIPLLPKDLSNLVRIRQLLSGMFFLFVSFSPKNSDLQFILCILIWILRDDKTL